MRIATAEQMRELDRIAIQERGIPSTDLMERAAMALASAALELAGGVPGRAACFCGPGNNGGDGIACARLLARAGLEVRCFLAGDRARMTPDARAMEGRLAEAGKLLGIPVVDHIIIGEEGNYRSMAEMGLLENRFEEAG